MSVSTIVTGDVLAAEHYRRIAGSLHRIAGMATDDDEREYYADEADIYAELAGLAETDPVEA